MSRTIAITTSGFDMSNPLLDDLAQAGWAVVRNPHGRKLTEDEVLDLLRISNAEAMIAGVESLTRNVFESNPQLRVVSRCGSGLDSVDVAAAEEAGIAVFRTPEAPAEAVSELTIALAITVLRRIGEADRSIRSGEWHALMGRSYGRSRIGIVGLGHVGSRVAAVSRALGAGVGYTDHDVDDPAYERFDNVETLARWADVLTVHLPHDEDTHHTIDSEVLNALGPGGVVVNTARGGLVDEQALHEALIDGRIAGAALDVFETEPYTGPLATLPNVTLTCHMGSYARQVRTAMETEALRNALVHLDIP
ncbi:MAG: NAD(P)-dependent oxidoreductase [Actinomycetota bacterium]|nr:NAD(P)-dependent oxidoreductase [Actinomycetota bacterium]